MDAVISVPNAGPDAESGPRARPAAEGKYVVASCDTASSNYRDLISSGRVINTGDVKFTAAIDFTWHNGDGTLEHTPTKFATVNPHQSKLTFFVTDVGGINGQLNFQDNPDHFHGTACTAKVSIK